jgi:hypothetical protein
MVHRRSHLNSLSFRIRVYHPNTCIYVRLLGPCFKTGRLKPFRQHPKRRCGKTSRAPYIPPKSASCRWGRFERQPTPQNNAAILSPVQGRTKGYNAWSEPQATFLWLFTPNQTDVDPPAAECTAHKCAADQLPAILVSSVSLLTISRTV